MIKAQGLMSTREFGSAVTVLRSLDAKPLLRDNTDMLSVLGEAHFYNGDATSACATLQRVSYRCTLFTKIISWLFVWQNVNTFLY